MIAELLVTLPVAFAISTLLVGVVVALDAVLRARQRIRRAEVVQFPPNHRFRSK